MAEKKPTPKKTTTPKAKTPAKKPTKVVAKKTPTKATTKKAPAKKPTQAAPKAPVATQTCKPNALKWQVIAAFLFAALIGFALSSDLLNTGSVSMSDLSKSVQVKLNNNNEFLYHEGKTWIPVQGNPMELIVLNDEKCGISCDPSNVINSMRQGITPALLVRNVDINSSEGKKLAEKFAIKGVPSFIFAEGADTFVRDGEKFVERAKDVLVEKDGLYLADSAKTGFKYGQFITEPSFDKTDEPETGTGPVTVVEFTDMQCPFCKRLHDQNKDLIERLVAEEKITYVVKDFPLNFHPEANIIHAVGNCVYKKSGEAKYFSYKDNVFANQEAWSGNEDAKFLALKYAEQAGANTDTLLSCAQSEEVQAEIQADMQEGASYGVTGTPALFIGTQIMPGAIGSAAFEAAVNAELQKKGIAVEVEESDDEDTEE